MTSTRTMSDFLGMSQIGETSWSFALGREMHGAFGGAFGGAVAACALRAARQLAPGRIPSALDVRFLRSTPAGAITAEATVLNSGRSLTTISVDMTDSDDRLCSRSTVGLVAADALHPLSLEPSSIVKPTFEGEGVPFAGARATDIPIVETLKPRVLGGGKQGFVTALTLPWIDDDAAEAVCMAADMCVGPPVGAVCAEQRIPHPNPDISLRFAGSLRSEKIEGIGKLERVVGGIAMVSITVWSGDDLVGCGVSDSMLMPPKER